MTILEQMPPFFIVGSPRSGTTLLRKLLNRHSLVCVPDETHFIPRLYKPFLREFGRNKQRAVKLLNSEPLVQRWNAQLSIEQLQQQTISTAYAHTVNTIMSQRAAADGKPFWGDKTPGYVHHIPLLQTLFPDARFIHIFRDGRDVALSLTPLSWGANNIHAGAREWRSHISAWFAVSDQLGPQGYSVRYETLCRDPDTTLRQLCSFLQLPFERSMLDGYDIKADAVARWRNQFNMSPNELAAFELIAAETLVKLGYTPALKHPTIPLWQQLFAHFDNRYKQMSNRLLRRGNSI